MLWNFQELSAKSLAALFEADQGKILLVKYGADETALLCSCSEEQYFYLAKDETSKALFHPDQQKINKKEFYFYVHQLSPFSHLHNFKFLWGHWKWQFFQQYYIVASLTKVRITGSKWQENANEAHHPQSFANSAHLNLYDERVNKIDSWRAYIYILWLWFHQMNDWPNTSISCNKTCTELLLTLNWTSELCFRFAIK